MNNSGKELLSQVIDDLEEEKKEAQRKLNHNLDRISEINVYLKSLLDKEDSDFKVFSPRNVESLYSNQISDSNEEKNALELENRDYYAKINKLNSMLIKLNNLLSGDVTDESEEADDEFKDKKFNSIVLLETERQRIAKDLHDTSLQNLTAIIHKVELASMYVNQDPVRTKLELSTISNSIKETINEIRETIFDLRPMTFDDFGFREMLDAYIEKEIENKNIKFVMDKFCLNINEQSVLLFLFRVIKECFGNAVRHSKCDEIHMFIDDSQNNHLILKISDNGSGFDINENKSEKNKHFGLIILKERVKLMQGNIEIDSSEKGTSINITIPINKQ